MNQPRLRVEEFHNIRIRRQQLIRKDEEARLARGDLVLALEVLQEPEVVEYQQD